MTTPNPITLARRLAAAALILLMQGPAVLVQEVAWARMLVEYSTERGLVRGAIETFDGRHPCKLCAKARELHQGGDRPNPGERPRDEQRQIRLAWADALLPKPVTVRQPSADATSPAPRPMSDRLPGRDRQEPGTPPSESA